jgi:hypothetical protein
MAWDTSDIFDAVFCEGLSDYLATCHLSHLSLLQRLITLFRLMCGGYGSRLEPEVLSGL